MFSHVKSTPDAISKETGIFRPQSGRVPGPWAGGTQPFPPLPPPLSAFPITTRSLLLPVDVVAATLLMLLTVPGLPVFFAFGLGNIRSRDFSVWPGQLWSLRLWTGLPWTGRFWTDQLWTGWFWTRQIWPRPLGYPAFARSAFGCTGARNRFLLRQRQRAFSAACFMILNGFFSSVFHFIRLHLQFLPLCIRLALSLSGFPQGFRNCRSLISPCRFYQLSISAPQLS